MEPLYHMATSIPLKEVSQMGLILVLMVAAFVIFHLPRPKKKGVELVVFHLPGPKKEGVDKEREA
jgi:hypothetical protein